MATLLLLNLFASASTMLNSPQANKQKQSASEIITAAQGLISRITPQHASQFTLEVIASADGVDLFEIDGSKGRVVLRGNNPVSLATAYHKYLKYHCKAELSWFGDQLNLPKKLPIPSKKERGTINGKYRVYLNYCTLSYTAPWWNWERWQREIDFMAMNSINMPLQPIGLDAVWYQTLLKMGFSDKEARDFLVTPAHQAWQWMPNIESYGGGLPLSWIESHTALARQIYARQLELGMQPIQQGFTGYVPKKLAEKFPEAKIAQQPEWYGFEGVSQLDPLDPLFMRMGRLFLETQKELFGSYGVYATDPFHESSPPVSGEQYLKSVGETIWKLTSDFDPQALIAMQAWSIREPIVCQFPKENLLVLDLGGATYKSKSNFWGYPFVAGNLHNFGGRINMHGDMALLASNQYVNASRTASNAVGSGLFMESIVQNPMYYAMAFEMPIHGDSINVRSWVHANLERSYGRHSDKACKAWDILLETVYAPGTNGVEKSSIIAARPAIDVKKSGPNDGFHIPYDPQRLIEAQALLLADADALSGSTIYRFHLVDLQRQIMTNLGQKIHRAAAEAYKKDDMASFRLYSRRFLEMLLDVDSLLATRSEWNFDKWVTDARSWGATTAEKDQLESDATALITLWGFTPGYECKQFDYSWREWTGLIRRYYYVRWKMFYDMLEQSVASGQKYSEEGVKLNHGREAFRANDFYGKLADWEIAFVNTPKKDINPTLKGDEVEIVRYLFDKYSKLTLE